MESKPQGKNKGAAKKQGQQHLPVRLPFSKRLTWVTHDTEPQVTTDGLARPTTPCILSLCLPSGKEDRNAYRCNESSRPPGRGGDRVDGGHGVGIYRSHPRT